MRVAIVSVKGGVGKSTLSLLLGKFFAENGKNSLVIDRDPLGWASKMVGIDGKGLLAQIADLERPNNYYKEFDLKGKLAVIKLYGDGPRFYLDSETVENDPKLKEQLEKEYGKIIKNNFDFYVVDNPSMVRWDDIEVRLELLIFKKILPNEKFKRIYLTDYTDGAIISTKNYIQTLENDPNKIGNYLGILVNFVPPFPEDIERAKEKVKDFEGVKIILPFIEELFMLNKPIQDVTVPEEIKKLGEYLIKNQIN